MSKYGLMGLVGVVFGWYGLLDQYKRKSAVNFARLSVAGLRMAYIYKYNSINAH